MNIIYKIKIGFSLSELMIMMLILSIMLAATSQIISKSSAALTIPPKGTIFMWYGSTSKIPKGWQLCDGTNGTPDLRSRFVYGAASDSTSLTRTPVAGWNANVSTFWPAGAMGGLEYSTIVYSLTNTNTTYDRTYTSKNIFLPRFYGLAYIEKMSAPTLTLANIVAPTN